MYAEDDKYFCVLKNDFVREDDTCPSFRETIRIKSSDLKDKKNKRATDKRLGRS